MRIIRWIAAALTLGVAACGSMQSETASQGGSPMIDVPTPPFPYNSKFCT
jgi:hypothetical protein